MARIEPDHARCLPVFLRPRQVNRCLKTLGHRCRCVLPCVEVEVPEVEVPAARVGLVDLRAPRVRASELSSMIPVVMMLTSLEFALIGVSGLPLVELSMSVAWLLWMATDGLLRLGRFHRPDRIARARAVSSCLAVSRGGIGRSG